MNLTRGEKSVVSLKKVIECKEVICIIPTLNEVTTITEVIEKSKDFAKRIIVVDGRSEDGTAKLAWDAGAEVIIQEGEGKGMALRTVFEIIDGDIFVIIDGDATYNPLEMREILRPIIEGKADIVIGSRLAGKMETGSMSNMNRFGNQLFNLLINTFFKGGITDSQSGFRALNRQAVESLKLSSEGFEIETEITIKALKQGLRVKEVPITYAKRRGSPSKLSSLKVGSRILKTIIEHIGD